MRPILNAMRLQARRNASDTRSCTVGIVTSYDPANYAVRVQLQAEGTLTGWLPLASPWIGNGWGLFAAPSVGDMVNVTYFGGDIEAGFVEGRLFNDVDVPLQVPSAEFWLVHQSGSFLKFTNDGDVLVNTARDLGAIVGRNLSANVAGAAALTVAGDTTATLNGNANVTVAENATIGVGGNATANVGGALAVTAESAEVTAPTTINGATIVNGEFTVNGATVLNGPISQTPGAPGGTNASLVGPLVVTNEVTANGIPLSTHHHTNVKAGSDNSGGPAA